MRHPVDLTLERIPRGFQKFLSNLLEIDVTVITKWKSGQRRINYEQAKILIKEFPESDIVYWMECAAEDRIRAMWFEFRKRPNYLDELKQEGENT